MVEKTDFVEMCNNYSLNGIVCKIGGKIKKGNFWKKRLHEERKLCL